ncbi:MAG: marine proteobacterial sortase target protein [Gammaproteobacteria bacterium]|nr:marine proteobacterial sortase target protein [Gammaproteobacteria bacterium]
MKPATPLFPCLALLAAILPTILCAETRPDSSRMLLRHDGLVSEALALSGRVEIHVSAMLARTTVTQRFENKSGDWAEGSYLFPLPEHASVDELEIRIGERRIVGEVREREDARRVLAEARASGRSAGLVEQHRAQLYSTTVTNIGPGETVEVRIAFSHRIDYHEGRFRLHFPTTLLPRYSNAQAVHPGAAVLRDAALESAPESPLPPLDAIPAAERPLQFLVELQPGFEITTPASLHHPVRLHRSGETVRLELVDGRGAQGRDFELEWTAARPERLEAALLVEELHGHAHALLMLVPPPDARPHRLARDLVLVIDRSGSMQGEAFEQAREALRLALDRMRPDDRFNLIAFNHQAAALFESPVAANRSNLRQAYRFLDALRAAGGTEMDQALALAMNAPTDEDRLRQLVFATDGAVGNETRLLAMVQRRIGKARLFAIGIGHGVNAGFLAQLAQAGRGNLTRIADTSQVGERTELLLRQLEAPVLTDLHVEWPFSAETWPDPLPDLYAGEPLQLSARLARPLAELGAARVRVTGFRDLEFFEMEWPLSRFEIAPGVAQAWARSRIDGLASVLPGQMDEQLRQDERLLTALDYRIVSDQTSLVAVDHTPRRTRDARLTRHRIPGELPADRDPALLIAMPATDGGTMEALLRGISVLVILVLLLFQRRIGRVDKRLQNATDQPEPGA